MCVTTSPILCFYSPILRFLFRKIQTHKQDNEILYNLSPRFNNYLPYYIHAPLFLFFLAEVYKSILLYFCSHFTIMTIAKVNYDLYIAKSNGQFSVLLIFGLLSFYKVDHLSCLNIFFTCLPVYSASLVFLLLHWTVLFSSFSGLFINGGLEI